jgi:hypothetical protein
MSLPFPGLKEADFDAYHPSRATSNAFVRPRLEVKEKLLAVGRGLVGRGREAGLSLDLQASDERPSIWNKKSVTAQWVFLWRDKAERAELERVVEHELKLGAALLDPTPYYRHAFLALYLDVERFEVGLRVHRDAWADVKNLRRRLESEAGRAALTAALHALPAGYALGIAGGEHGPAREGDAARVASLLDAAVEAASWWYVARALPRAEAVALGEGLRGWIESAFDALLPLYSLVAWRRDEDLAAVSDELARERAAREAQAAEALAREAERLARLAAEAERRREQALAETRARIAAMEPARPAAVQAAIASIPSEPRPRPSSPSAGGERPHAREQRGRERGREERRPSTTAARPSKPAEPSRASEPAPRRPVEWVDSDDPVTLGVRVRIRRGPFAGKVGTVIELTEKGQAKVSLGLLSARVECGDLVTLAQKS